MARFYTHGSATLGTTPTLICNVGQVDGSMVLQNTSASTIYLGASNVASSGANLGISVSAGATFSVPSIAGSGSLPLYGIVASGSAVVVYLYPSAA